jgi:uncharacterized protein YndB with AHSA1/START domain
VTTLDAGWRPGLPIVERILPASVEDVYAAWTDPVLMNTWLAPTGQAQVEADVRVGGRFRVVMVGEGMRIEHSGEYLAVDPPHRLVFTWRSPYTGNEPSIVTVVLTGHGNRTHLALSHDRLPREARSSHQGGWSLMLDQLVATLERTHSQLDPGRPAVSSSGGSKRGD